MVGPVGSRVLSRSATCSSLPKSSLYQGRQLSRSTHDRLHGILIKQDEKGHLNTKYRSKYGADLPSDRVKVNGKWTKKTEKSSRSTDPVVADPPSAPTSAKESQEPLMDPATVRNDPNPAAFTKVDPYEMYDGFDHPKRHKLVDARSRAPSQLDWVSIMEYKKAIVALDESLEKQDAVKAKILFRNTLEKQIHEKDHLKVIEEKEKLAELEKERLIRESLYQEMDREAEARKVARYKEKEARRMQIADNLERKERIKAYQKLQNEAMLAIIKADTVKAKQEAEQKKRNEKLKLEKVKLENEATEALKRSEAARLVQEEKQRQTAYSAMVEAQEKAREAFYQNTAKRQEANVELLVRNTAEATRLNAIADERMRAAQVAHNEQQDRLEQAKIAKHKAEREAIAIELANQIAARKRVHEKEVEDDRTYCSAMLKEFDKKDAREAKEKAVRKQKLLEQSEFLGKQVIELEHRKAKEAAAMSPIEEKLNGDLLRKITSWDIQPSIQSGVRPRPY